MAGRRISRGPQQPAVLPSSEDDRAVRELARQSCWLHAGEERWRKTTRSAALHCGRLSGISVEPRLRSPAALLIPWATGCVMWDWVFLQSRLAVCYLQRRSLTSNHSESCGAIGGGARIRINYVRDRSTGGERRLGNIPGLSAFATTASGSSLAGPLRSGAVERRDASAALDDLLSACGRRAFCWPARSIAGGAGERGRVGCIGAPVPVWVERSGC